MIAKGCVIPIQNVPFNKNPFPVTVARARNTAESDTFDDDVVNFCHVICLLGKKTVT